MTRIKLILSFVAIILLLRCGQSAENNSSNTIGDYDKEKMAILNVINSETKTAFQRDYESWKENWVHDSSISKSYQNFVDGSHSETIGWDKINDFVKTYFEKNPEPDPLPSPLKDMEMRWYGNGAWVVFEQRDLKAGIKRETRLMEKVNGVWKIAGMHTSIYELKKNE